MVTMLRMDHNDSLLIDQLGGNAKLSEIFGISSQAVSKWRKEGIPAARLMYLKLAFPDVFSAAHALRSDQKEAA